MESMRPFLDIEAVPLGSLLLQEPGHVNRRIESVGAHAGCPSFELERCPNDNRANGDDVAKPLLRLGGAPRRKVKQAASRKK